MSHVITVDPCPTKFVGDMVDMIISTDDDDIDFALEYDGENIIEENYVPAQGTVRISGLDKVIDGILHGLMLPEGGQDYMSGTFSFYINEQVALSKTLYVSHQRNMEDTTGQKHILSHGSMDVCYPGMLHPITFIEYNNSLFTARLYNAEGDLIDSLTLGGFGVPYTQNCEPSSLFPMTYADAARIVYSVGSDTFQSFVDPSSYPDGVLFRFLNMYDAPETLLAKKVMNVKPAFTDDIGVINGQQQRFSIEMNDEFTADSGALMMPSQYLQWHDLMMSRQVEMLYNGEWLPIIINKHNYQQAFRKSSLDNVTFTFKLARERDSI